MGTPESRKAWMVLRGPYALGYLTMLFTAILADPFGPSAWTWKIMASIIVGTTLLGAVLSFCVTGLGWASPRMIRATMLEVTGLRLLIILELAFGMWRLITLLTGAIPHPSGYILVAWHLTVGFLAWGMFANLTWRKKASDGNG